MSEYHPDPEPADDADPGIGMLWAFRVFLGVTLSPGDCRDCGGMGQIPDVSACMAANRGIWKTCPSCRGHCHEGTA